MVASERGTRDRILDVALDLFVQKGYAETSLREIAAELGFSKAALYYHFTSKADILMALHMRLHGLADGFMADVATAQPSDLGIWRRVLDGLIDQVLENRKLFLLHARNQAALEEIHHKDHDEAQAGLEDRFRSMLNNQALPLEPRVRVAAAFGSLIVLAMAAGQMLEETPADVLAGILRRIVADVIGDAPGA